MIFFPRKHLFRRIILASSVILIKMSLKPQLIKRLGTVPTDLLTYLESLSTQAPCATSFSVEEMTRYTDALAELPEAQAMGLWILHEERSSEPYCYISKGPCAGAILHFYHDMPASIPFASLADFLKAQQEGVLTQFFPGEEPNGYRQDCQAEILRLLDQDDEEQTNLICLYLSVCPQLSEGLLTRITTHDDFFIPEALALWLQGNSQPDYLPWAVQLSNHPIAQVQREGIKALQCIQSSR